MLSVIIKNNIKHFYIWKCDTFFKGSSSLTIKFTSYYISVCFSCNCRCDDIGRIRGRCLLIGWEIWWIAIATGHFGISRENVVPRRCQLYHPCRRIHLLQTVEKDLSLSKPPKKHLANNIIVANTSCIGNNTLGLFTFHCRHQQKKPARICIGNSQN